METSDKLDEVLSANSARDNGTRSGQTLIYVDARGFPVKVWHPVQSIHMHGDCYKILESNTDPEHVYWEFTLGDVVRCAEYEFAAGETGLIACARCECSG